MTATDRPHENPYVELSPELMKIIEALPPSQSGRAHLTVHHNASSRTNSMGILREWCDGNLSLMIGQDDIPLVYRDMLRSLRRDIVEAIDSN